jgi:hypothetical protein
VTHYSNSEPPAIRASIRHDKDVYIGVRSDVRTLMLGTFFQPQQQIFKNWRVPVRFVEPSSHAGVATKDPPMQEPLSANERYSKSTIR